jgi:hypothetical protein
LILLAAFVSLRLESVQHTLAKKVSEELSASYGVPTEITAIEIYSINEIRLKGVLVKDLRGDTLLHANEAQAHLNTAQLFDGLIRINTIGLGTPDIRLNRATADAPLNIQFIIDIINGKKKKDKNPKIDLQINQVSIYDGKAAYDTYIEGAQESTRSVQELKDALWEATEAQSAYASSVRDAWDGISQSEAQIDMLMQRIDELANKDNLSAQEQGELNAAVKTFNALTGESVHVIDEQNGVLDVSSKQIKDMGESWKNSLEQDQLFNQYADEVKQIA